MFNRIIPALTFSLLLSPSIAFSKDIYSGETIKLSLFGSYKNLLTASETLAKEDFWSNLNRLRLEFDLKVADFLLIKTIFDNEILIGSLLKKGEFLLAKESGADTLFDLDKDLLDNPDLFWRQSLYRLYFIYSTEKINLTVGRQRVAWGTGRLWNPTDLFNPISPLKIERGERVGVDAVNLEYFFGSLSSVSFVYAPREENGRESYSVKAMTNLRGYDLSLILGKFRGDEVIGFDFAGNIKDSGFRGEWTFTDPETGSKFTRLVLSWDYIFSNTLYLLFEYLYNGGNLGKGTNLAGLSSFSGEIATRNRNFIGSAAGYDLTPLIRSDLTAIIDIDDGSVFMGPLIRYNLLSNLDWTIGGQFFSGSSDSEFGGLPDTYYTSMEWFF